MRLGKWEDFTKQISRFLSGLYRARERGAAAVNASTGGGPTNPNTLTPSPLTENQLRMKAGAQALGGSPGMPPDDAAKFVEARINAGDLTAAEKSALRAAWPHMTLPSHTFHWGFNKLLPLAAGLVEVAGFGAYAAGGGPARDDSMLRYRLRTMGLPAGMLGKWEDFRKRISRVQNWSPFFRSIAPLALYALIVFAWNYFSPHHDPAIYKAAIEFTDKKDFDAAIKELDAIIGKNPSDSYAYRLRGNAFNRKGEADHALADYNTSLELYPKDAVTLWARGDTYQAKGDLEKAMADYAAAIDENPKSPFPFKSRGDVYLAQRKPQHALADYFRAVELSKKDELEGEVWIASWVFSQHNDPDRAIAILSWGLEADPASARLLAERAKQYAKQARYDDELADYRRAIQLSKPDQLYWLQTAVDDLGARKDFDRALSLVSRAIEIDPANARWLQLRAEQYAKLGRYDQELADYLRALELSKKDELWWVQSAVQEFSDRKDNDRAALIAARAVEIDPTNARWLRLRAEQFGRQGQYDQELADYLHALKLNKKDELWWVQSAVQEFVDRMDHERAAVILARAIEADPTSVSWLLSVTDTLVEQKKSDFAISLLTRALTIRVDDTDLHVARAKAYKANGQEKEAEADIESVIQIALGKLQAKPDDADAYFVRASAYAVKGLWNAALADAKHGLTLLTGSDLLVNKGLDADAISSAHDAKQFQLAVSWDQDLLDQIRRFEIAEKGKADINTARALAALSYQLLFVKHFDEALAAVDEALALAPDKTWISIRRAHALMFLGRAEEANAIYSRLWKEYGPSALDDFNEFEKMGLTHPQIAEIRALHQAGAPMQ